MTIKLRDVKKKLLKSPKVRAEYQRLGSAYTKIRRGLEEALYHAKTGPGAAVRREPETVTCVAGAACGQALKRWAEGFRLAKIRGRN